MLETVMAILDSEAGAKDSMRWTKMRKCEMKMHGHVQSKVWTNKEAPRNYKFGIFIQERKETKCWHAALLEGFH